MLSAGKEERGADNDVSHVTKAKPIILLNLLYFGNENKDHEIILCRS